MNYRIGNSIVEFFEEFLEKEGRVIPNAERNEVPNAAIIYGTHYDDLVFAVNTSINKLAKKTLIPISEGMAKTLTGKCLKADLLEYVEALYHELETGYIEWKDDNFRWVTSAATAREVANEAVNAFDKLLSEVSMSVTEEERASLVSSIRGILDEEIAEPIHNIWKDVIDFQETENPKKNEIISAIRSWRASMVALVERTCIPNFVENYNEAMILNQRSDITGAIDTALMEFTDTFVRDAGITDFTIHYRILLSRPETIVISWRWDRFDKSDAKEFFFTVSETVEGFVGRIKAYLWDLAIGIIHT